MENETPQPVAELTPTWGSIVRIWWAFFWKFVIIIGVLQVAVSWVIVTYAFKGGNVVTFVLMITTGSSVLAFIVATLIPMKMVVGKQFKEFRLSLVKNPVEKGSENEPEDTADLLKTLQ